MKNPFKKKLSKIEAQVRGQEAMNKIQAILDEHELTLIVQQSIVVTPRK